MTYLNLFANCLLVKGANRSLICDLQLNKSYPISNGVYDILSFLKEHAIEDCIDKYGLVNEEAILSYVDFILYKELGFKDDRILEELAPLNLSWDNFSDITNVIIEYNENLNYDCQFIKQLFNLNVSGLEIRCYHSPNLEKLGAFLETFNGTVLNHIKLILPYSSDLNIKVLEKLIKKNLRIKNFLIHSAPSDTTFKVYKDSVQVIHFAQAINNCLFCGMIRSAYFTTNIELFTESQHHNTCLNRKLSITGDGLIKNCPSMQESYGNMLETELDNVLADKDFRKYWNLKKDDVAVCKECEFRYVCTDCRAFTEQTKKNNEGLDISKPLKCGYNPYTNQWDEWSTNPLKQKAIQNYGMQQLNRDA
ncbi:grasp-with-spasm system SPASM domain peptide maturase [Pedobacter petrophilus]|uniref:Grasp-with-spasm system SPASM domain peptide maturase n=1 Tax=Pedobacter petrophilus TaxID=1908241 RepID=A0A7K0G4I3_9SPHI|nr:grasp-with-spasm system SPASM domain peptide maturase [Pedobacter petrophilus]MRX78360.1 grasp-with-spasm system SPASM domain peptide maturase [Pedobacter petrophilus]